MPDFSSLLRKPAGEAKKPQALPPGDYTGVIKSFELGDQNKNKTPYVRFHLGLNGWPESIPDEDKLSDGKAIDLNKRQLRRDYFFTEDALWRLDELLHSIGIDAKGRTYEECLPDALNAQVLVEVQQYMNQQNNEIGNQVGKLIGQS